MKLSPLPCLLIASACLVFSRVQSPAQAVPSLTLGQNFKGSTYGVNSSALPADANGAIGPGFFVEFINGTFAVYNRTNGTSVKRIADTKFWSNAGVLLSSSDAVTDPRVIYDPVSQRWFASMVDFDATAQANGLDPTAESNDFLLAVSLTSDPRGAWKGFLFQADPDTGAFADFPTLGVDSNGVYLSGDMYTNSVPVGPSLWSFPKSDLVAANPIIDNATYFGVMDYDVRGEVLQPASCFDGTANGKVVSVTDLGYDSNPHSNLVSFAVLNAAGPGAILTPSSFVPTPSWVVPYNDVLGVPTFAVSQPDGTQTLDANDARISAKSYVVNGVMYVVHNTLLNNRVAIRWYRVRAADNALLESGTIADPNQDLFFPSIAANPYGVVVIAFNGAGPNTVVSAYAAAGQTINGITSFGSSVLLKAGLTSYHGDDEVLGQLLDQPTLSRWGDYSATSPDPSDPNRFWTIQMFPSDASNSDVWSTQITELITTPVVVLAIQKSGSNLQLSWPVSASNYHLQVASTLGGAGSWSNATQAPVTNGVQLVATVPIGPGKQFFRLQAP